MDLSDVSKDEETMKKMNEMISAQLRRAGYEEKVKREFVRVNEYFDNNITDSMNRTQKIFDELSENVASLENEEKVLRRELSGYITAADVIVLDDDDDDKPRATSDLIRLKYRGGQAPADVAGILDQKPPPTAKHDPHGLTVGQKVLANIKRAQWFQGTIIEITEQDGKNRYKVRLCNPRSKMRVNANHLARIDSAQRYAPGQVPVGSRIAAHYKSEGIYSGIVAEVPDRRTNRGRYLVFYDDGYAMYCSVNKVYLVYEQIANVWEDITYVQTAEYIKEYLSTTDHKLLTLKTNQMLRVEFKGEWHDTRCATIDCSLVEVTYEIDGSREWIYRGSLRLEPLYKQQQMKAKAMQNKSTTRLARAHTGARGARFEYIDLTRDSSPSPPRSPARRAAQVEDRKKNIGKKSTGGVPKNHSVNNTAADPKPPQEKGWRAPWERPSTTGPASSTPVTKLPQSFTELRGGVDVASSILEKLTGATQNGERRGNNEHIAPKEDVKDLGRRKNIDAAKSGIATPIVSKPYVRHTCSKKCVEPYKVKEPAKLIGKNPLEKPLHLGWTREFSKKNVSGSKSSHHVYYKTPCGRTCRSMNDIDNYMKETGLEDLDYTEFCFDHAVRIFSNIEAWPRDAKFKMEDYSGGKEAVPVSCVNQISEEQPPQMPYTKQRVPGIGVKIETSSEYMVCCDCPDNCRDRSKCPCQQLTVTATTCCKGGRMKCDAGYVYKRLHSFLQTGIYECSPRCKCNSRCPNRVVQHGLQCRLQLFKTHKKGWGIRCLDDIAKGTFVCIYTGKIQNEEQANKEGLANGDEYLAELDHIEVAERYKDNDDAASSSGYSEVDFEEDNKKDRNAKSKSDDSGAETTDSESEEDERPQQHVTVTLKRDSESRWTVEPKAGHFVASETDKNNVKCGDVKKNFTNGRKRSKCSDHSDSDHESRATIRKSVPPPKQQDEDELNYTTDTDSDSSTHDNRPQTAGPPSQRRHDTSSQNIRLNSSYANSYDNANDDETSISQTRKYFGTADTFVIDAKQIGNLGRYLNHSCSPNLLVQNVFIDTHDLRFPWVAFFANSTIRAGTELTWDYNYEIGSVEGREIICYCGATKCRKRLL